MFSRFPNSKAVRGDPFILLTICVLFLFIGSVWAEDDAVVISVEVNPKIIVDSPVKVIEFEDLEPGDVAYTDPFNVLVSSNKNWQLDVSASNGGKLALSDGTRLISPFLILKPTGPGTYSYVPVPSQIKMMDGNKPGGTLTTNLMQIVLYYDSPGSYSGTLTFVTTQT